MSWDIFRSEYKNGHASLESSDKTKMANVIASSYDKCIKTGFANAPAAGPLAAGNVKGFEGALNYAKGPCDIADRMSLEFMIDREYEAFVNLAGARSSNHSGRRIKASILRSTPTGIRICIKRLGRAADHKFS